MTHEEDDFIQSFQKCDRGTVRLVLRVLRAMRLLPRSGSALVEPEEESGRVLRAALAVPAEEEAAPDCNCRTHRHEMGIPCPTHDGTPAEREARASACEHRFMRPGDPVCPDCGWRGRAPREP